MAIKVASLFAEIGADTRELQRGLIETKAALEKATEGFDWLGGKITNVGKMMTVGLTLPVVTGFGMMIDKASDLSELLLTPSMYNAT